MARELPKPKTCAYDKCGKPFVPARMGQKVCATVRCSKGYVEQERAKKEKLEKADFKRRKEAIKPVSEWEDECRDIVQEIARIRDRKDGCISCDLPSTWGGQWHGSHFRSVGACSALQFHLWNIHKACSPCNRDKGGNIHEYRPRLIEKIGADKVEWLYAQNAVSKRSGATYIEYLKRFKRVMGKRLRRMKKRVQKETA